MRSLIQPSVIQSAHENQTAPPCVGGNDHGGIITGADLRHGQQAAPSSGPYGLTYYLSKDGWNYDSGAMSQPTFDITYSSGIWTLEAGGNIWNLSLTGDLYPNAPIASFSAGTWSGGVLNLTSAEAAAGFSVTTNVFSTNFLSGSGFVGVNLGNLSAENFPTFTTPSVTLNVAGGALGAGTHYLSMDFQRIIAMDSLVSGYVALVGYNANTNLTIQVEAIPEPSSYAAIFGVLALLGVLIRRRGRTA